MAWSVRFRPQYRGPAAPSSASPRVASTLPLSVRLVRRLPVLLRRELLFGFLFGPCADGRTVSCTCLCSVWPSPSRADPSYRLERAASAAPGRPQLPRSARPSPRLAGKHKQGVGAAGGRLLRDAALRNAARAAGSPSPVNAGPFSLIQEIYLQLPFLI